MTHAKKLAIIGFDSISLPFLETFVERGVMPTVKRLMEEGCVTQTWPSYPMETATNWACLATGASPTVHGCNMGMPAPGGPLGNNIQAFPAEFCKAEQLWSATRRAGKKSIVFDWTQSYPLAFEDGLIHVGEDGRPHEAIRALQESRAYTTNEDIAEAFHVARIAPVAAEGWATPSDGALEFEMPIKPTGAYGGSSLPYKWHKVSSLVARVERGPDGFDAVSVFGSKADAAPLFTVRLGEWSEWGLHTFVADGEEVRAHVRAKLVKLSPDGTDIHLYVSEIYPADGFAHPLELAARLVEACGPYVIQCSRQQVVIQNASDIETYFQEQEYMGEWYRKATGHVLANEDWDLFMFKWHGPDWTNHLTMYMIDPEHAMYDPDRADEAWALWDRLMGLGDEIVKTAIEAAGEDCAIALVSDHGGVTSYGGRSRGSAGDVLRSLGLDGADGSPRKAYVVGPYVHLNTTKRPGGFIEPDSDEYHALREQLIDALLDVTDDQGRHAFRAVLPIEDAARMGIAGDYAGDIFLIPVEPDAPTKEEFFELHPYPEKSGTYDWPRLNSGAHSDDPYFIVAGPGVRKGYRRERPTLITSVAPTCAQVLGVPTPKDADGAVLWDFFD